MEYNGAVGAVMLRRTPLSDYEERKYYGEETICYLRAAEGD